MNIKERISSIWEKMKKEMLPWGCTATKARRLTHAVHKEKWGTYDNRLKTWVREEILPEIERRALEGKDMHTVPCPKADVDKVARYIRRHGFKVTVSEREFDETRSLYIHW